MTDPTPDNPPFFLGERDATAWFMGQRGGPTVLDDHLSAVHDVFGREVDYRIQAATDPLTGRPALLIVNVAASPDDPTAWERLVELQRLLIERRDDLAERSGQERPYRHIIVALGDPPIATIDQILIANE